MIENNVSELIPAILPEDPCEQHLAEILASGPFRASGRSQQFLQYVVHESLSGRMENLKERVIGERIFGRPADYDTGQDSIVRVKANEVRRRLSQYYEQHPAAPCRFEMAAGAYSIHVRHTAPELEQPVVEETAKQVEPLRNSRRWPVVALCLAVPILLTLGIFWMQGGVAHRQFERFWKPFLTGKGPLLICIPSPEVYRIYGAEKQTLLSAFVSRPPIPPDRPPMSATLRDVRVVPEPGMFLGLGDARVWAVVSAFAASRDRDYTSRLSSITSLADLNTGPSVIVGAETNQWHAELIRGGRYQVTKVGGKSMVQDIENKQAICIKPYSWEPAATYDCAVVTRLGQSGVGHPLLLASGLDHFGTYALGDFLTSPKLLEAALRSAPADWESKNFQILIRVERLRDGTGPPEVIATHVW